MKRAQTCLLKHLPATTLPSPSPILFQVGRLELLTTHLRSNVTIRASEYVLSCTGSIKPWFSKHIVAQCNELYQVLPLWSHKIGYIPECSVETGWLFKKVACISLWAVLQPSNRTWAMSQISTTFPSPFSIHSLQTQRAQMHTRKHSWR